MFFISADGKKVGAALVALATSLIKKFFSSLNIASLDRKILAAFLPYIASLLTAVTITLVPGITSDSLAF
jgi:hypothetical protein